MKFIVYWTFYMSSVHGAKDVTGSLQLDVSRSKAISYVFPSGYQEWDIVYMKYHRHRRGGDITSGEFILRNSNGTAIVKIHLNHIYTEHNVMFSGGSHQERVTQVRHVFGGQKMSKAGIRRVVKRKSVRNTRSMPT